MDSITIGLLVLGCARVVYGQSELPPNCGAVFCPPPECPNPTRLPGQCCAFCPTTLPPNCAAVLCAQPTCSNPTTPPRQCCPVCPTTPPHCAAVLCAQPNCPNPTTPPGQCCPVCPQVGEKPGRCPGPVGIPRPVGFGICPDMCSSDFDCPGNQKCCGCNICMRPVGGEKSCFYKGTMRRDGERFKDDCNTCTCTDGRVSCTEIACTGEKPGRCPRPVGFGHCAEMCSSDFSCPGSQKCCSNGCGHTCRRPVGGGAANQCPQIECPLDNTIPRRCRKANYVMGSDGRTRCRVCDSNRCENETCTDRDGRPVTSGNLFMPEEDPCLKCECVNGTRGPCMMPGCVAPTCRDFVMSRDVCCNYTCLDTPPGPSIITGNCANVLCPDVACFDPYTPPGQCCPRCRRQGYARRPR